MIRKLKAKFIAINMGLVLTVLLVMFGLVYGITSRDLREESVRMLRSVAAEPMRMWRPGERDDRIQLPYFVLQFSPDGSLAAVGGHFDLTDQALLSELLAAARADGQEMGDLPAYGFRYCFGRSVWGECVVFADISSERATLANLVRTCLAIGVIALAAFFLISLFLARWAVRPVERAWEQQRQFVADASHELKTPLAVILTDAELLGSPTATEEQKARYAGDILTMSNRMRGLVGSLLDLTRVENGAVEKTMERLDLSALIEEALLPFEPLYFERELTLESEVTPGIRVNGSSPHLRQTLEILLDNGLKYADAPGTVTVRLGKQGRRCLLAVSTPGAALSKEELSDIFKRFYRADKARAMDDSYGLGLAIAREIVTEHRGRIWAESAGGRNTFFVELPTAG